jgi:hypothetical protein
LGEGERAVAFAQRLRELFVQFLTAQSECIDKAVTHIEAKQLGSL